MTVDRAHTVRLFPLEPYIDPSHPFDNDIIGNRKQFADGLTALVSQLTGPAVLLLDAPWGAGKTTFANDVGEASI
jgi:hypothetical protein